VKDTSIINGLMKNTMREFKDFKNEGIVFKKLSRKELKALVFFATDEMIEWNNLIVDLKKELKKRK